MVEIWFLNDERTQPEGVSEQGAEENVGHKKQQEAEGNRTTTSFVICSLSLWYLNQGG